MSTQHIKPTIDPYTTCPIYETEHFTLRLVEEGDAKDLLACYADRDAWEIFNADCCTSDFRYQSVGEMRECIGFWLDAYSVRAFVRFAIVDKANGKAVGTIEMFGDKPAEGRPDGVLRIDIASPYEKRGYVSELLTLADEQFFSLFEVKCIYTKAVPAAIERIAALEQAGYAPFEWKADRKHYYDKTMGSQPF